CSRDCDGNFLARPQIRVRRHLSSPSCSTAHDGRLGILLALLALSSVLAAAQKAKAKPAPRSVGVTDATPSTYVKQAQGRSVHSAHSAVGNLLCFVIHILSSTELRIVQVVSLQAKQCPAM
ncbi:unnamed protein product, partial [Urochloa humidicola]